MKKAILFLLLTVVFGSFQIVYAQTNQQLELKINEQKTVENTKLTIKFVSVLEDSRCPEGVNCIQAGNAKVQIIIKKSKGASKTFELNTNGEQTDVLFEGYKIKFVGLTPTPNANIRINCNEYTATFEISKI